MVRVSDYPLPVLPDGVHSCTEDELHEHFVEGFTGSPRRQRIFDGFIRLRTEFVRMGIPATQWVDGSFVEGKPEPGDIDVVTYVDYDLLNGLAPDRQTALIELMGGRESTKAAYLTHTFLVPFAKPEHPYFDVYEAARKDWRTWFGRTRNYQVEGAARSGVPKGIVQLVTDDAGEPPAVSPSPSTDLLGGAE